MTRPFYDEAERCPITSYAHLDALIRHIHNAARPAAPRSPRAVPAGSGVARRAGASPRNPARPSAEILAAHRRASSAMNCLVRFALDGPDWPR